MTELVCGACGKSKSSFFITIGSSMICKECALNHKGKLPQVHKPQVFLRYLCKTHDCGTYSVGNMMNRHVMDDCVVITQETLGIIRPATFGGLNGDIGRIHFLGINQFQRLLTNLENYKKFVHIYKKKVNYTNVRISYHERKYFVKHLRYLDQEENPDYHKHDEAFKKIKYNLNIWIQQNVKSYKSTFMSNEERNKLYYKQLTSNFLLQVKAK